MEQRKNCLTELKMSSTTALRKKVLLESWLHTAPAQDDEASLRLAATVGYDADTLSAVAATLPPLPMSNRDADVPVLHPDAASFPVGGVAEREG